MVLEIAGRAVQEILRRYATGFEVDYKSGREPVTEADRAADRIIVEGLRSAFPEDFVLSEEAGFTPPWREPATGGAIGWFVDPIDGTKEFIKRNGEFAVQIARTRQGRLDLGVVWQPEPGTVFLAQEGKGCFRKEPSGDWTRLKVSRKTIGPLVAAVSRSHPSSLSARVLDACGGGAVLERGSVGLKLMAIAQGEAHFYLNDSNSTKAWDIGAPEILFREAGGTVTDLRGLPFFYDPRDPFHKHGLLASCDSGLHATLLEAVTRLRRDC